MAEPKLPVTLMDSQFVTSVPKLSLVPEPIWPEVALLGRSNVGKSSWINAMLGRKQLAKTSNTPGKTRQLNYYEIKFRLPGEPPPEPSHWFWVDLPGYGYAKVSKTEQAHWRKELERFLLKRSALKAVILLLDARHGILENDQQMWDWLQHNDIHPLIVLTKLDKLPRREWEAIRQKVCKQWLVNPHFVIAFSAETQVGRVDCWQRLLEVLPPV